MGVPFISKLRILMPFLHWSLPPLPVPDKWFNFWTLDSITGLPTSDLFNVILVCIDKLIKLVRLVPFMVGDGELAEPAISRLVFTHVVHF